MGKKLSRMRAHSDFFWACIIMAQMLICGCSHFHGRFLVRPEFKEANDLSSQGNHKASLSKYEQIIEKYPASADRALFEMGIIYAYHDNEQKDYRKALECFQKLIKDYPESGYRQDSEMMVSHINNIIIKDKRIMTQQTYIETLQREIRYQGNEIYTQQKRIEALEQEVENKGNEIIEQQEKLEKLEQKYFAIQNGPADKVLIEKKERRLTLLSKGRVLSAYKIALGGDPDGPKERQGDSKTPEGTYIIDSRNKDSRYHISLHISYPNTKDRKRARELGVSPGGDIMIHGIKKDFSWIGDFHAELDWTKGCIAVTNKEIEEIAKLVPNGTIVEIRP